MELGRQRGKKELKLVPLSEWYDRQKMNRLIKVIKAEDEEIMKGITLDMETLKSPEIGKLRVGNTRTNWLMATLRDYCIRTITMFRQDLSGKYSLNVNPKFGGA